MTDTQTSLNLVRSSVAFLLMAACQNTQPIGYCAAAYSPAVIITAEDSGTHANLAVGASGLARSGAYVDSLRRVDSVLWGGARIGNYQLTVERLGYHQMDPHRCAGHSGDGMWDASLGARHRAV